MNEIVKTRRPITYSYCDCLFSVCLLQARAYPRRRAKSNLRPQNLLLKEAPKKRLLGCRPRRVCPLRIRQPIMQTNLITFNKMSLKANVLVQSCIKKFTSELVVPTEHNPGLRRLEEDARSGDAGGCETSSGADCTGAPRPLPDTCKARITISFSKNNPNYISCEYQERVSYDTFGCKLYTEY